MNQTKHVRAVGRRETEPVTSDLHESDEPTLSPHEILAAKETGYRQALFQAWFATALEQTKSVFTLASAGVGLSLTLIFGEKDITESWAPTWLLLAAIAFALAAWFCICVLRINAKLVQKLVQDNDSSDEDGLVGRLDWGSRAFFAIGLVFLLLAASSRIWLTK